MVVDPARVHESWVAGVAPVIRSAVAAQTVAARNGESYVAAALLEQGIDVDPEAAVSPGRLVGVAGDGRPVATLADVPRWQALDAISAGVDPRDAMLESLATLTTMMATVVQDAGRGAESLAIAARPRVGYTRMLVGDSCSRCVVLAGKFFRWNVGFDRHPQDDCVHIPTAESVAGDVTTDPRTYFDGLTEVEQDRTFTRAGAQAIRDGADLGQVVNARRGMSTATTAGKRRRLGRDRNGVFTTTEGATRHRGRGPRLMPESIYEIAEDRADAVRLLKINGYLT